MSAILCNHYILLSLLWIMHSMKLCPKIPTKVWTKTYLWKDKNYEPKAITQKDRNIIGKTKKKYKLLRVTSVKLIALQDERMICLSKYTVVTVFEITYLKIGHPSLNVLFDYLYDIASIATHKPISCSKDFTFLISHFLPPSIAKQHSIETQHSKQIVPWTIKSKSYLAAAPAREQPLQFSCLAFTEFVPFYTLFFTPCLLSLSAVCNVLIQSMDWWFQS